MLELRQAVIVNYSATDNRRFDAVTLPNMGSLVGVHLPVVAANQAIPPVGSVVLVASMDPYQHYVVSVLRDPLAEVNNGIEYKLSDETSQLRGVQDSLPPPDQGEVLLQAIGTSDTVHGHGAMLHLTNSGTAVITSSSFLEKISVGGSLDDSEHLVQVTAPNVSIESMPSDADLTRSFFKFDEDNTVIVSNELATIGTSVVSVPISELKMTRLGAVTLRNTTAGADKAVLKLDTTSEIDLFNPLGSMKILSTGDVTIDGPTITLNSGTLGVARLTDQTLSDASTDAAFWSFIQTLIVIFNSHVHVSATVGNPTSVPVPLLTSAPSQLVGKINSSSSTVTAG